MVFFNLLRFLFICSDFFVFVVVLFFCFVVVFVVVWLCLGKHKDKWVRGGEGLGELREENYMNKSLEISLGALTLLKN